MAALTSWIQVMRPPYSRLLAFGAVLLVAGLVYFVVDATRRLTRLEGLTVVSCDRRGERVFAAGWGEVRILDESGRSLGSLRDRAGEPADVTGVSSVAAGDDGRVWIVESTRRRVSRFSADGTFECVAAEGPEAVYRSAAVLPLPSGRFVVADTLARRLRLYGEDAGLLRELDVPIPNGLLPLEDGLAVVVTQEGTLKAFDGELEPRSLPEEWALPNLDSSIYEIDVDGQGNFYYHLCPRDVRCTVHRRTATSEVIVAADHWLEGYDDQDPSYSYCSTSDGRILIASRTLDAVVEYEGALAPGKAPPKELSWDQLRQGHDTEAGVRVRLFGDEPNLAWIEAGRHREKALEWRVSLGRTAMGGLLTVLLAIYLYDRLLGRHQRWETTVRHAVAVVRRVLWPDRSAIARWAAPSVAVAGIGILTGLGLSRLGMASPAEGFAVAVATTFLVKGLLSGESLALRRSPLSARAAFELYLGSRATRPLSWSVAMGAEDASFATQASHSSQWSDRLSDALQETGRIADDAFEPAEFLEGHLHLVAYGRGRLVWYPCQLGGKPKGPIKVAACRPARLGPGMPGSSLRAPGGRLVGVHPELVRRVSAAPAFGEVETLCEECGREIIRDSGRRGPGGRCRHYLDRQRPALAASLLLPGLGHLVQRQFQRGRWLALASGLLVSRLLYLGVPVVLGTLPWRPSKFVLPVLLYAVLWWIAMAEVRKHGKERGEMTSKA